MNHSVFPSLDSLPERFSVVGNAHFGIDGKTGKVADMKATIGKLFYLKLEFSWNRPHFWQALGIFDTFAVKQQTLRPSPTSI